MSVKAFDVSTLQTAVEVVTKPDGLHTYLIALSRTHALTHSLTPLTHALNSCTHSTHALTQLTHSTHARTHALNSRTYSLLLILSGYVYGEVAAPSFVLPLFAILAVLTAAIPFVLRPGNAIFMQLFVPYLLTHSL